MALSFAVNLGPLSEIEFGYKDVATAVYLANDLRGWWKARERAISLEQTLGSSGTSLVPSFTFNSNLYLELRRDYSKAWGVARTVTNTITRLCLPRASTATEGSPGLLCLRALTTALLCFVDQEQTPYILKDILPSRLFHYDQADKEILIEGPYFAALVQYVQSIATEEGADEIRAHLLRHTDSQLPRVTSATLAELQNIQNTEVGHLAGFLDWLLTAIPKRQTNCYRTRSLKVWCLALVLSDLGFEVEADRTPMIQRKEPSQTTPNDDDYNKGPMVVLVLAPGWHTDTGRKLSDTRHDIVNRPINVPPRLVPIRALPSLVFTDYAHNIIPKKTVLVARDLEEAFFGTYIFVRHHLSCDQKICDAARFSGPLPIDSSKYKILLESSCDTTDIKSFYKRVEVKEEYGVLPDLVKPYMVPAIRAYLVPFRGKIDRRSMNFMVTHIRVACVLAIISLFVMGDGPSNDDTGLDLQLLYTGSMWENTGSVSLLDECYTKSNFFVNYLRSSRDSSVRETLANPIQDPSAPRLANPPPGPASRPDSWSSLVLKASQDLAFRIEVANRLY
ncbi:hypothetical protein MMC27_006429 [Xylographa pallens]|nr:hypothetical protein [Xylographa pallens]